MISALDKASAIKELLVSTDADTMVQPLGEAVLSCLASLSQSGEREATVELLKRATESALKNDAALLLRLRCAGCIALLEVDLFEEALELAAHLQRNYQKELSEAPDVLVELRITEAVTLGNLNRIEDAKALLYSVRSELLLKPDGSSLGRCSLNLGAAFMLSGDQAKALEFSTEALVSARRVQDRVLEARALFNLQMLEKTRCRWASAEEAANRAWQMFEAQGASVRSCHAMRAVGIIAWKRGNLARALELADQAVLEAERLNKGILSWFAYLLKGMILLHQGVYDEAKKLFTAGESWIVPQSNSRPSLLTSEFLGDIHLEQGEAVPALKLYDEVFPKAMALVPKGDIVAELRRRRAECYLLLDRHEDAYTEARTGLDHCRELGDRYEEAATYRVLALAAAALGNPREARQLFEQGFSFYEDIETPFEWGKLWMSYGDWLSGPNAGEYHDLRGALEAYVVAREHFERMGAKAKLAMVNAKFQGVSAEISTRESSKSSVADAPKTTTTKRRPHRTRADRELDDRSDWALKSFGLITRHRPLLHLLGQVEKLSKSRSPVLILGESGTGKELVARGVHRLSGRKAAYLPLNCGAIPRDVMESELFGHMAGSFTGALRDKPGLFEVCDQGTVFLDEIGELNLDLQSKLLRFLETGESRRVGATRNIESDVRIVAATNRDRAALEKGQGFRVDLYYRLAHAVVELPPLRGRGQDIELLIEHFLALACRAESRNVSFSGDAMDRLVHHSWPGNIRQLRGVIEHAVLVSSEGETIGPEHLQLAADRDVGSFEKEMEMVERRKMEEALRQHRGSKAEAARSLRMPRTTFLAKMKRYGMA